MLEIALMIEGQDGVNWPRWQRLGRAAEDLGFVGLYRSDHFSNPEGPVLDALELWTSLTWLAGHTGRIEFGPLVSPVSFRHPVETAWRAIAVDDLSGGRLQLGLGAGWQEREHSAFGFDLLDVERRFARFEGGLEVVTRLLRGDGPVSFSGEFYRLEEAQLLPRPARRGGPPIVIGGNGPLRTLPLVAKYADEWNGVFIPATKYAELSGRLDDLLNAAGRRPGDVRRSLMSRAVFGRDAAEVQRKLGEETVEAARTRGMVVGTADEIVAQLAEIASVGVQRAMLQWVDDLDDLAGIEALARGVVGRV